MKKPQQANNNPIARSCGGQNPQHANNGHKTDGFSPSCEVVP
jgi:hypothetical protein